MGTAERTGRLAYQYRRTYFALVRQSYRCERLANATPERWRFVQQERLTEARSYMLRALEVWAVLQSLST